MEQNIQKPNIFVGSSTESLDISYAIQENLEYDADVTVWDQDVFKPSRYALESLEERLENSDFGIFVFSADDITVIRDQKQKTARDNVIFELGLFIGWLGKDRCFIFKPREEKELHLPSDLMGVTPLSYPTTRGDGNLKAALAPSCNKVRKVIRELGAILTDEAVDRTEPVTSSYDESDIRAALISWMKSRSSSLNTQLITYADVDEELGLPPGSTKIYIEAVATVLNYQVREKGNNTILFKSKPARIKMISSNKFGDWEK